MVRSPNIGEFKRFEGAETKGLGEFCTDIRYLKKKK